MSFPNCEEGIVMKEEKISLWNCGEMVSACPALIASALEYHEYNYSHAEIIYIRSRDN